MNAPSGRGSHEGEGAGLFVGDEDSAVLGTLIERDNGSWPVALDRTEVRALGRFEGPSFVSGRLSPTTL
jgi:hypothetical protein